MQRVPKGGRGGGLKGAVMIALCIEMDGLDRFVGCTKNFQENIAKDKKGVDKRKIYVPIIETLLCISPSCEFCNSNLGEINGIYMVCLYWNLKLNS